MYTKRVVVFWVLVWTVGALLSPSASEASPAPCRGTQLTGAFTAIHGSAGAGSISYALRVRNRSSQVCFVSGLPLLRLEDKSGRPLPTHVSPAHPGQGTAAMIILRENASAWASARFSPDVPGPGETAAKQCERTAYRIRVTLSTPSDTLTVPMRPPTPVCEHGAMLLSLFGSKRPKA